MTVIDIKTRRPLERAQAIGLKADDGSDVVAGSPPQKIGLIDRILWDLFVFAFACGR